MYSSGGERPSPPALSQQGGGAGGSPIRVTTGRVASGPDKAGTCQHCQMARVRRAGWKGVRKEPAYTFLKVRTGPKPGGYGPGAARTRPDGRGTPGPVFNDWPGDHGEVLRGSRGDAAGTESGSSFIERITVNTGTVPVLPVAVHPVRRFGLGASTADRSGMGRSRRSTPSRGEPVHMGKGGSGIEKGRRLQCRKTRRRMAAHRSRLRS